MLFRNPFAGATSQGPQNTDPNKRNPNEGNRVPPGTENNNNNPNNNPNFRPSSLDNKNNNNNNDPSFIDPNSNNNNDPKKQINRDDPIEGMDSLWDDPTVDPNDKTPKFDGYLPKVDDKQLSERLNQVDFMKGIKPETLAAVTAGGEGAVAALAEIINSVGRQSVKMSFTTGSKFMEAGLTNAEKRFMNDLVPGSVRSTMTQDGLTSNNPLMKLPQYAPMVKAITQQFEQRYPKATPSQIEAGVNKYFDKMYDDQTAVKTKAQEKQTPSNTQLLKQGDSSADWDTWMDEELQTNQL